jgi:hypothetical protein
MQASPATWPERLALQEKMLASRLDALRSVAEPVKALYDVLSEEQKKTADTLLPARMGRM